jgi:serine/threonine-protein kinase
VTEAAGAIPPKLVGKYTLLRELGSREVPTFAARFEPEGGAAVLVVLERYVTEEASEADDTLEKAAREAEPLTALAHPNLAGIRAVMATGTDVIVASDFVAGETYADLTRSKDADARLSFRARLRVLLDVLTGLGAIHEVVHGARKRVHGDLAPDNVIVGLDGRARLVRVCNLFPEQASPASPTLGFIAPELVQGAAGTALVDARVDLYSAGVLLWEILTGKRLMVQTNSSALLLYELDRPPRGIPSDDLPWAKHLIDVAKRALAPAAERWSSAAEMIAAIEAVAAEPGSIAPHEEVAALVTRIAGEKIAARRAQLDGLEPRPAAEATPSITTRGGARAPRAMPERALTPAPGVRDSAVREPAVRESAVRVPAPVPLAAPPVPAPVPLAVSAAPELAPSPAPPEPAPAVAVAPAVPSTPALRSEDRSASIVFPLHRKRRTVTWAIAGAASLIVLIGVAYFATRAPASTASTSTTGASSTPPSPPSVPSSIPSDVPEPPSSAAAIDMGELETIGPSGHRVRKRRRPAPPAPTTSAKKKFEPQGI